MKLFVSALGLACAMPALAQTPTPPVLIKITSPTVAEADAFVAQAEKEYAALAVFANQTSWINATYITEDTDAVAAKVGADMTEFGVKKALEAARYQAVPAGFPSTLDASST